MYLDLGCQAGGSLTCQNQGTCGTNGFCQCPPGWTGSTCAQRIFIVFKLKAYQINN